MTSKQILLPGTEKQFAFLQENLATKISFVLVIGSTSEKLAENISKNFSCKTSIIVNDYISLINSQLMLKNNTNVDVRLMEYEATDFDSACFNLVYAQASISLTNRNKIIKEIRRILKPGGYFCVGEIVSLKNKYPAFIKNILDSSNLDPLFIDTIDKYYLNNGFNIIAKEELNTTLKEFYERVIHHKKIRENLSSQEKSYYKKIFNRISHESNAYLKLGGDKYLGFITMLLQKGES